MTAFKNACDGVSLWQNSMIRVKINILVYLLHTLVKLIEFEQNFDKKSNIGN